MNRIIEFLENPKSYEEKTDYVKRIETHISIVFLTSKFAYKMKKPVNFGFLDYTTLSKRKYFCEKEIELNRRMAEGIYLGTVYIGEENDKLFFNRGKEIEYLVKMKKIPDDTLLSYKVEKNLIKKEEIFKVGEFLGEFHLKAQSDERISEFGTPENFKVNTDENFEQTKDFEEYILTKKDFQFMKEKTEKFYEKYYDLMLKRVKEGKIKDCHGDIRLEHVTFFENKIRIIDCIEFNERFRFGDILLDAVFLKMELDSVGKSELGDEFMKGWIIKTGENFDEIRPLYYFYLSYRAFVRAKVTGFLLKDPNIKDKDKIIEKSKKLFLLSKSYIENSFII
ncbi:MAG: gluconokinase [Candidatus Hydrothermales bacterium]